MKNRTIWAVLLLFVVFNATSQINFSKGEIVTTQNDTLKGYIKDLGTIRKSNVCYFKESKNGKAVKYSPTDIKSFRVYNDGYYRAKTITIGEKTKDKFIEVLLEGKVDLFYYPVKKNNSYFIQGPKTKLLELSNDNYVYNAKGGNSNAVYSQQYSVINKKYTDGLYQTFRDCKDIHDDLKNVVYNKDDLMNISKKYVGLTCDNNEDCITYEKELVKKRKGRFGVYGGPVFSQAAISDVGLKSDVETSTSMGAFYYRYINRIDHRLAWQIEFQKRNFSYSNYLEQADYINSAKINEEIIGVPFLLKYRFFNNRLSPTVGLGKELGLSNNSTTKFEVEHDNNTYQREQKSGSFQWNSYIVDVGLNYKISETFSVFANIRYQHFYNVIEKSKEQFSTLDQTHPESNYLDEKLAHNSVAVVVGVSF